MGNVFNRYGAGGGKSEGLYIWKKSEWITDATITNPTFALGKNSTSTKTQPISASDIDLLKYPTIEPRTTPLSLNGTDEEKAIIELLDGFNNSTSAFYVLDGVLRFKYSSYDVTVNSFTPISNTEAEIYVSSNVTMRNSTYTYNGQKTLPPYIGDMVGFVVSDKENAYPDKEVKDGYYYERVSLSTGAFNCTKYEVGTIYNAMTGTSLVINHSLGVKPKYVIAWQNTNGNGVTSSVAVLDPDTNNQIYCANIIQRATLWTGGSSAYTQDTSRVTLITYTSSTSYRFQVADFHYVILA